MPYCTKCEREFSGDIGFCPYCKIPLVKERRSFARRTVGGPGGFKLEETPEYLARKSEAVAMMVGGILIFVVSLIFGLFTGGLQGLVVGGLLGLMVGGGLAAYGNHYWSKVTHIMWTRQALREYGAPSIIEGRTPAVETTEYELIPETEEELQRYLALIEKRLLEGKISEETYKELKLKYKEKLEKKLKEERILGKYHAYSLIEYNHERTTYPEGILTLTDKRIVYADAEDNEILNMTHENIVDAKSLETYTERGVTYHNVFRIKDSREKAYIFHLYSGEIKSLDLAIKTIKMEM